MSTILTPDIHEQMTLPDYLATAPKLDETSENIVLNNYRDLSELLISKDLYSSDLLTAAHAADSLLRIVTRELSTGRGATLYKTIMREYIKNINVSEEGLILNQSPYVLNRIRQVKEMFDIFES